MGAVGIGIASVLRGCMPTLASLLKVAPTVVAAVALVRLPAAVGIGTARAKRSFQKLQGCDYVRELAVTLRLITIRGCVTNSPLANRSIVFEASRWLARRAKACSSCLIAPIRLSKDILANGCYESRMGAMRQLLSHSTHPTLQRHTG